MQLYSKTAIVYGAAGAIGSAVARAYAREGANVHLAGRTAETLARVGESIRNIGGTAHIAPVDVLDRAAVERHAAEVVELSGSIDICFNATSNDDIQGKSLMAMALNELMQPVTKSLTAHFNIATTAATHMARGGDGVILVMAGGREAIPRLGGSHVAWAALAGLSRQLAADLGPDRIRVAWILSPGSPGFGHAENGDDDISHDVTDNAPAGAVGLLPQHQPSYEEVAETAVFLASDAARTMTAAEVNLTGGAVID
jgi:NAD(P)-dependent dehydrogenase (short-subunit alcohol dehydrogenase family)